ncbi:MAG: dockerin type I repeat-containing protein [Muribaculaceae bacterium]|nr:dockerin type I repeat-containing protein [Muribaculaceae bacterium]
MKKFLALLFVSAALTSMAAVPHVNTAKAKVTEGKAQKTMVMKSNTLANQLTAPVMKTKVTNNTLTPQRLFSEKGVNPGQNMLMKRAPRRVAAEDVLANKIAFMYAYSYDSESGSTAQANDYLYGGWTADMEQVSDNQFYSYIYFTSIPFTINVDYSAKTAEMVMETLRAWHWIDTVVSGKTTTYNDTTEYIALWDEAFMMNDDENAEPANLQGTLYEDGTIYFPDGWTLYDIMYVKKTSIRNGAETVTYDTIAGLLCDFMHETYLMTANAKHEYVQQSSGATVTRDTYMYQYDDTTAVAWNLWGMGNRGMVFFIHEDGTMEFPSYQVAYTEDISDYATAYTQYNWDESYEFYNFAIDLDIEADTAIDNSLSEDSKIGVVDANGLYWDASVIYDLIQNKSNGNWYFGLGFYPFLHNKLTFNDPNEFFMLGVTADPIINYVVNDENVVITLEVEEGAQYLMTVNGEYVESPYTIARTEEDQTVTVMAVAQAYGKNVSNVVQTEITIPALEAAGMPGDVDNNGIVNITDVTVLISAVMSENYSTINADNADMNGDGTINVTDVTLLISMVMAQ